MIQRLIARLKRRAKEITEVKRELIDVRTPPPRITGSEEWGESE
jgi:hypothetical protein